VKPPPQFLRIRWEETTEQDGAVTLEAMACLRHRREVALAHPSARGAGRQGRPAISAWAAIPDHSNRSSPNSRRSQLGSPDGGLARPGRSRRNALSNKSGIGALLQGARGDGDAGFPRDGTFRPAPAGPPRWDVNRSPVGGGRHANLDPGPDDGALHLRGPSSCRRTIPCYTSRVVSDSPLEGPRPDGASGNMRAYEKGLSASRHRRPGRRARLR
jgi:hypothetical protein